MPSDTPRTDAALTEDGNGDKRHVPADFARELERELTEAQSYIADLTDECKKLKSRVDGTYSAFRSAELEKELAVSRARIAELERVLREAQHNIAPGSYGLRAMIDKALGEKS